MRSDISSSVVVPNTEYGNKKLHFSMGIYVDIKTLAFKNCPKFSRLDILNCQLCLNCEDSSTMRLWYVFAFKDRPKDKIKAKQDFVSLLYVCSFISFNIG